jgi:PTH1 family peptidyl-tRNA hydrolase
MKLIIGLGNPGDKYKNNRHNIGFMFVDYIVNELVSLRVNELNKYQILNIKNQKYISNIKNFEYEKKLQSDIFKVNINGESIILAKPQTFMNKSGLAVKKLISNYKLQISNLYVVHDDLDIPLGKFKIQKGVGPKLHNGVESIEKELGTKDFWRVRMGIDNRQQRLTKYLCDDRLIDNKQTGWVDGETYVLQDFTKEEKEMIGKVFKKVSYVIAIPVG